MPKPSAKNQGRPLSSKLARKFTELVTELDFVSYLGFSFNIWSCFTPRRACDFILSPSRLSHHMTLTGCGLTGK